MTNSNCCLCQQPLSHLAALATVSKHPKYEMMIKIKILSQKPTLPWYNARFWLHFFLGKKSHSNFLFSYNFSLAFILAIFFFMKEWSSRDCNIRKKRVELYIEKLYCITKFFSPPFSYQGNGCYPQQKKIDHNPSISPNFLGGEIPIF